MNQRKGCLGFIVFLVVVIVGTFYMLNAQYVTKRFGGTTTIDIPAGKKLVPYTVQWEPKESNLWYLTEDVEPGYKPKSYEFRESSNLGALEGKIVFVEHDKEK